MASTNYAAHKPRVNLVNGLRIFFRLGLVRALIAQFVFMFGTMGIMSALGASAEAAWFLGAVVGVLGSLLGSGVIADWLKWCVGRETVLVHGAPADMPEWSRYFGPDVNHKVIGIQYGVASLVVLLVGGLLAVIFRLELSAPGLQFLAAEDYNTIYSAHGIIMIAGILLGVGAMLNYLVPIMIGAHDMAFPRLNAFSFWIAVPSATLLIMAMFVGQGWDSGWTGYPPLSTTGGAAGIFGVQLFLLGFYINGFSSIAGAINILVTVATMRAKGMTLWRMPIFVWAGLSTALLQFTVTQTLAVSLMMVMFQRLFGMNFFNPTVTNVVTGTLAEGVPVGNPLLYQHLFWFYSHPAVYVFILPGLGIVSELLPVFSRKPLFGYKPIALASIGIAFVGMLVWAHHMFTSGMNENLRAFFMFTTMMVAVPTGIKFFSWLATMWGGKLELKTPMLFVLGAISVFLIGGLSGPILGTIPTDLALHDTYWVVGHFHATMFGGYIFPFFAAIYYWYPKITGRMYNETLGKIHFYLMVPGFWVMSLGQMRIGLMGMRRRIADYDPMLGVQTTQILVTVAALIIGWSILIMIYNLISSARTEKVAAANPWGSRSPEWQIPAGPIPEFNYDTPFEVVGEPYDYGLPGANYTQEIPAAAD